MKYIYESPDKGKTIYRYPIGHPDKRELIGNEPETIVIEDLVININKKEE